MSATDMIEVRIPAGVSPTAEDRELLTTTLHAIVELRYPEGHTWPDVERVLGRRGWTVRARLMWVAEARRGREIEQAVATTRDEAYEQVLQLTKLDELTGVT